MTQRDLTFEVKVIPRASQNKIIQEGNRYKVYLTTPPVEGKANKALIEFLADHFKVKKQQIAIIKGEKSREKLIRIVKANAKH